MVLSDGGVIAADDSGSLDADLSPSAGLDNYGCDHPGSEKYVGMVSDSETASSEEEEEEDVTGSEEDVASWISWFCSLRGNEFFCEVDEDFIQDDFNLSGLSAQVPYYDHALDLILDADSPGNEVLTGEQHELVESAAEMLYGLIHVRYILTSRGMTAMFEKFKTCEFGRCPRVLCHGQACLPAGLSDLPRQSTIKVFCPKCEDMYYPRSRFQRNLDGAYFGTTFPHLLLMSYPQLRPSRPLEAYQPRVFGFKLHASALRRENGEGNGTMTESPSNSHMSHPMPQAPPLPASSHPQPQVPHQQQQHQQQQASPEPDSHTAEMWQSSLEAADIVAA
ncbi:hypothetical protein WJX74_000148 [Apatococcus lobatus]|uniref:Casein kinase II subunit beta n=1 Tax=Apatococcus lobatus TaxID=904363 RepID=A0AAW1Q9D1_9CHLO